MFLRQDGTPVDLVLYKYDACPYCQRVLRRASAMGLVLPTRDTRREPAFAEELRTRGGKYQVPCLFVDGVPLYESEDILEFLEGIRASTP